MAATSRVRPGGNPGVTRAMVRAARDAVEAALRQGYPARPKSRQRGALRAAAEALGLSSRAVGNRLDQGARLFPDERGVDWSLDAPVQRPDPCATGKREAAADVSTHPVVIGLRERVRKLEADLKAVTLSSLDAENIRSTILGLTARTPSPPAWLAESHAGTSTPGVPVTVWSDWHIGEVVTRMQVNGVNEFDLDVAERRIRALVERTLDLCFSHMVNPDYPGIVVNLGGDMFSGEIHEELKETNELPPNAALLWLLDRLAWALDVLAGRFGRVFVPCVPGNHGRDSVKPRAKDAVVRTVDWLLYCLLERHFRDDPRIRFQIPDTGEALYSIHGHRYMLVHGHDLGVKGGDGIIGALGPIMRGEMKMRWSQAQIDRDFDTLVLGHWHQALPLPRAIVNNALKGYCEYARGILRAPYSRPSQLLWFHHPRRGIGCRWEIYLEDRESGADLPWCTFEDARAA